MKFKKLLASVMTSVLALGMLPLNAVSDNSEKSDSIGQVLADLSLKAEPMQTNAAVSSNFRRPINNESPVWIVHIDSWNYADPEKIIDLVPEDVLPYVVFNISLSINWSSTEHRWLMIQDGIECARSWIKACADKGVWTMIQPSSGGQSHFPDYSADYDLDNTIFGEFFRDYPNFIGYNYCEQFWGFASQDFPVTYQQRYDHFAALLKLCNKYGGYLDVSWCENQWGSALNPVAMLKTNSNWEKACRTYAQNFILEEKYTQLSYIADVESEVYGAYISGYCGNYGVRWDDTGWSDYPWIGGDFDEQKKDQYRLSTSLPVYLERMAMNGMTVIDGPELVWADCVKGLFDGTDSEGYKYRRWEFYDQCKNVNVDLMRKFIDGSLRIPNRKEVIDRTKVVVIQDVNSGGNDDKYCSYKTLFEGLYRADNDGNYKDNHNPYKSTGRYQTIPTVYALADDLAKSIPVQIKQSTIPSRWKTIADKQAEFNKLYPDSYYANCYVANNKNTWMTYYNSKVGSDDKGAQFNLKYNTCKSFDIKHQLYGSALINEYADHIDVYLNNYDEEAASTLRTEVLTVKGASVKPTFTAKDRGANQTKSAITENWSDGTYTLTVKHNGPVDISIKCSGNETGRSNAYPQAVRKAPAFPDFYTGARQYEGENFDMKNIEGNVTNGCGTGLKKYQGMGFVKFGNKDTAAVKDTVKTSKAGTFKWTLRYSATSDVKCVDLYVNGAKVKTLSLPKGSGYDDWKTISENINLKAGDNKIELKANATLPCSLYLDNFKVEGDFGDAAVTVKPLNGKYIKNLIVNDKENASDWLIADKFEKDSLLFGDREITAIEIPKNLIGTEIIRTACDSKMYTDDLGTFTAGSDISVYVAIDSRVSPIPAWLESWQKADSGITSTGDLKFVVYKKDFKSGENAVLGMNGGSGDNTNYFILAKPVEKILNGTLIKNLLVYDSENAADWSIQSNFKNNSLMFGDRDITYTNVPSIIEGSEYIRTACDSKLYTDDLAEMTAGADMTAFVAIDTRVTPLPEWLKDWTDTNLSASTSNDLTMKIYSKSVKKNEKLILGTDGGMVESVNYSVFAKEGNIAVKGDVNMDGKFDINDVVLLEKWLLAVPDTKLANWKAADLYEDDILDIYDLCLMKHLLVNN